MRRSLRRESIVRSENLGFLLPYGGASLEPPSKLDSWNVNGSPEDVGRPNHSWHASEAPQREANVVPIPFDAGYSPGPSLNHIADRMHDRAVHEVNRIADLAKVLHNGGIEEELPTRRAGHAENKENRADGLPIPVLGRPILRNQRRQPHPTRRLLTSKVWLAHEIQRKNRQACPGNLGPAGPFGSWRRDGERRRDVRPSNQIELGEDHARVEEEEFPMIAPIDKSHETGENQKSKVCP